jgi:hypothetical protein
LGASNKEAPSSLYNGVCSDYYEEMSKYDWNVEFMLKVMQGESNCRPNAKGDNHLTFNQNNRIYGYSVGLLQIRILPGREHCDTYDISTNILCAYNIYKSQGYKAWTVARNLGIPL